MRQKTPKWKECLAFLNRALQHFHPLCKALEVPYLGQVATRGVEPEVVVQLLMGAPEQVEQRRDFQGWTLSPRSEGRASTQRVSLGLLVLRALQTHAEMPPS